MYRLSQARAYTRVRRAVWEKMLVGSRRKWLQSGFSRLVIYNVSIVLSKTPKEVVRTATRVVILGNAVSFPSQAKILSSVNRVGQLRGGGTVDTAV